ncbi:MAG: RidA family protein [Flavobacteriaceae bacterium]
MKNNRRSILKKFTVGLAGIFGISSLSASESKPKKIASDIITDQDYPLFSSSVKHGNTLYIAGKGAHFEGDIKDHTDHVLKEIEKALIKNGSSMEKVLKVNVYLADLADYKAMNQVYIGRFGKNPPVRTTVATYGGVPGNSLVEIDCIASLD